MNPISRRIISQIISPGPMGGASAAARPSSRITLAQIVRPTYAAGAYNGPERRAQGYLIAEVIEGAPQSSPPKAPGSFI